METNPSLTPIQSIDQSILTPFVRKAVHSDTLNIQEWSVSQLGGGAGNPVSVGLYRFQGIGQDQANDPTPWSMILKVIQSPEYEESGNRGDRDDQTHWNYWKREALIYQSRLLETMPGGLTAPRCFGVVERPGRVIWLWLEDITDSCGRTWSLDRYALAARHLGQLNGIFLSARSLPSFPWFSRHRLQQWIDQIPWQTIPWEHPQVLEHYPRLDINFFQRMLAENDRFLEKFELLPQTLCHGDTYPTNLMARDLANSQPQTVALDWGLAEIAPVGADLGQLVFGAQNNLKEVNREEVDMALFDSYLAGLRDSGSQVDSQLVRFGYTVHAALQIGLFQVYLLSEALKESENMIASDGRVPVVSDCFEVVMANEAYKLLGVFR